MASKTNRGLGPTLSRNPAQQGHKKASAFSDLPLHKSHKQREQIAQQWGIKNPFFKVQEARTGTLVTIEGRQLTNFAWCDYLGLSEHPSVLEAAKSAIDEFGSSVSASRMMSGELQMHRQLEVELGEFCGFEESLLFVSGYSAKVSTIGTLIGPGDLIVYDEFLHTSAVIAARLSGARCRRFRHNNLDSLTRILKRSRSTFKNALVLIEGLYSTEGDCPALASIIAIKESFGCWLMLDDSHGLGVLGQTGRGTIEHAGIDPGKIDIFMGTLSKTLASCGAFIAGNRELIEILKYSAPGFVFSVGLPPVMTATALAALHVFRKEPSRVQRLRANSCLFFGECHKAGLNTGLSVGSGMIPIIVGSIKNAGRLTELLFERGINVSPIIYPGVPINSSRLRFFISSENTAEQLRSCVQAVSEERIKAIMP
jgi:8-amino-7-oxononanoate synthase